MTENKFKKGDPVRIISIEKTRRFGTGETMRSMVNNFIVYEVQDCDSSSVKVNGYYWDPEDVVLSVDEEPKEEKIFLFDTNEM